MAGNVLKWKQALAQGHQPALYSYRLKDVPIGEYAARLDFKIWAKEMMAISCYFSLVSFERKIQLTVYCTQSGRYQVKDGCINFVTCPVQRIYRIKTIVGQKKKIIFKAAALVE